VWPTTVLVAGHMETEQQVRRRTNFLKPKHLSIPGEYYIYDCRESRQSSHPTSRPPRIEHAQLPRNQLNLDLDGYKLNLLDPSIGQLSIPNPEDVESGFAKDGRGP
jgi:hypothetical protein